MPVYLIVALGPLLRKTKMLTPEMDKGVMSMAVHLFYPCLILDKMLGVEISVSYTHLTLPTICSV